MVVRRMAVWIYFKFCYPNLALEQFGNTAAMWKQHNMLPYVFSKKQKSTDKHAVFSTKHEKKQADCLAYELKFCSI